MASFRTFDPLKWVAFAGPAGPSSTTEDGLSEGSQIKRVSRLIRPPAARHEQGFVVDDVVVVELAEALEFSDTVRSICLADEEIQPGQLCVVAGWDKTISGGKSAYQIQGSHLTLSIICPQSLSSRSTWSTCPSRPYL